MTAGLMLLLDWLTQQRVSRVIMEVTPDYWKPVYYLLEANGFEVWLAKHNAWRKPSTMPGSS